eukprot:m.11235 g.11235  ORF g.11235 m.11235 type:complete len:394 (+) comp8717_c0_seq1:129-1310(+)
MTTLIPNTVHNTVSRDDILMENWQVVPESHFELDVDFPCEELITTTPLEDILWGEILTESKSVRENETTLSSPATSTSPSRKRQLEADHFDFDTIDSGCESEVKIDAIGDALKHQTKRCKLTDAVNTPGSPGCVKFKQPAGMVSVKCATCEGDNDTADNDTNTCRVLEVHQNTCKVSTSEKNITTEPPKIHQQQAPPPPKQEKDGQEQIHISKHQRIKPSDIAAFFDRVAIDCVFAETNTNTIIIGSTTTTTTIAINPKPSSDSISPLRRRKIPYANPKEELSSTYTCAPLPHHLPVIPPSTTPNQFPKPLQLPTAKEELSSIYSCAPLPHQVHPIPPSTTPKQFPKPLQLPTTLRATPKSANSNNCQFFLLQKSIPKQTTAVCTFFRPKTST